MSTKPPIFIDTRLPSPITEFAPQIMSNFGGSREQYASGTAVIVAPHLAFAARHVLEDHYRRYHDGPLPDGELTVGFSFLLAQLVGDQVNLWTVERLWAAALTDIFLLSLKPLSEGAAKYQFKHLALDLLPPAVGEEISAFGYCDNTVETSSKAISVHLRAATSHGLVQEVHYQRRDIRTLPFPCFRTNARFDGGMSGGPVFNQSGSLCGLVCSTFPPYSAEEEDASYVALLWPAMAIPLDLNRAGQPRGVRYRLFDLVRDNILVVANADLVDVDPLDEGVKAPRIAFRLPASRRSKS